MVIRKLLFLLTLAVAIGAVAPAIPASASPVHGQLSGRGTLGQFGDPTVSVNAIQTPWGLKGGFVIAYPDGTFVAGRAACLVVAGNTAYLTSQITGSVGPRRQAENWFSGSYIVIGVQDNGEPGTAGPDLLNFSPGFATDPGCGPNGEATPVFPLVRGGYLVVGRSGR
jgi:hypothetical protein